MDTNIKKLKKIAAKKTIRLAKNELLKMKKKGEKINLKEFEDYVKFLYEDNLKKLINEKKTGRRNKKIE